MKNQHEYCDNSYYTLKTRYKIKKEKDIYSEINIKKLEDYL